MRLLSVVRWLLPAIAALLLSPGIPAQEGPPAPAEPSAGDIGDQTGAAPGAGADEQAEPAGGGEAAAAAAAEKKEEAKRRFLRGIELADNDDWDAAVVEFLASRQLYATRVATLNAARALHKLKRYVEALDMYQALLDEFGDEIDEAQRKQIEQTMASLREIIGDIVVESSEMGTTVIIDGQQRGQTPLKKPIRVKAGTHTVRAYKEGFLPFEEQIMVAGAQRQTVMVDLKPLTRSGQLRVTEAGGGTFDVIVDGASVGDTPWQGPLGPGEHTVLLRGEDKMGTMPNRVEIEEGRTTALSLRAQRLDATLRIEPTPSDARVAIDGVTVGNGVWEGAVSSGSHQVEVFARGFLAFRTEIRVGTDKTEIVQARLRRNPQHPMWGEAFRAHVYLEATAGAALSPSFGGSAGPDAIPVGVLGGLRAGYALISGLGVEVTLGYLAMRQAGTRTQTATADPHVVSLRSDNFTDQQRIAGPLAALSASYQVLDTTPLTFRITGGAARVNADFDNGGTFQGVSAKPGSPDTRGSFSIDFDVREQSRNITMPFVGGEVRFGYRFSDHLMVDGGIGALVMFAQDFQRRAYDGGPRSVPFARSPGTYSDGSAIPPPGNVVLPRETAFGTFVGLFPTVAARYDF